MKKKKSNKPLVSILIPNYNYEKHLEETIKSALAQTYPNIEILFLDNHSTDNSYKIAKKYRKYGVKVYRLKRNIGVKSHNILLHMAKGKYVHVLHSDDSVLPTFIEECVELMEKNPNVGYTVTERMEIDQYNNELDTALPFYDRSCIIPANSQRCVLLMASYYIPSQTVFRREVLERTGFYEVDITNFMDWWLLYKCSCVSDMGCINKPLCRYRIWVGSSTSYMVKNLIMPLNGYLIRREMLNFARKENDIRMLAREEEAREKQADLTLKLGVDAIRFGLLEVGEKYLELAQAYSLNIVESSLYKGIKRYLENKETNNISIDEFLHDNGLAGKRVKSYSPPEDYLAYE